MSRIGQWIQEQQERLDPITPFFNDDDEGLNHAHAIFKGDTAESQAAACVEWPQRVGQDLGGATTF